MGHRAKRDIILPTSLLKEANRKWFPARFPVAADLW
jgi:hypothetical protein